MLERAPKCLEFKAISNFKRGVSPTPTPEKIGQHQSALVVSDKYPSDEIKLFFINFIFAGLFN